MNWKFWQKNKNAETKKKKSKAGNGQMPSFLLLLLQQ